MSKFYCNICNEDVILRDGKCPKCNTNWHEIIDKSMVDDNSKHLEENDYDQNDEFKITEIDIKQNITFFLKWGSVVKTFCILISIVITVLSFILTTTTDGFSLILLIIPVVVIFAGIIFENSLKWKAYMLYTNNKKKK